MSNLTGQTRGAGVQTIREFEIGPESAQVLAIKPSLQARIEKSMVQPKSVHPDHKEFLRDRGLGASVTGLPSNSDWYKILDGRVTQNPLLNKVDRNGGHFGLDRQSGSARKGEKKRKKRKGFEERVPAIEQ